jgi:hypothetical protein
MSRAQTTTWSQDIEVGMTTHACCEAENAHHPDSLSIPSISCYIH